MYYTFTSLQEAQLALDYVNRTLLALFPVERQSPEGLLSVDYNKNLLPNGIKTTSWADIQQVGNYWIFLIPTEENSFLSIPKLELPVTYGIITQEDLTELMQSLDDNLKPILSNDLEEPIHL